MSRFTNTFPDADLPRAIRDLTDCLTDHEDRYRDLGHAYHKTSTLSRGLTDHLSDNPRPADPPIPNFALARRLFSPRDETSLYYPHRLPAYGADIAADLAAAKQALGRGDAGVAKHYVNHAIEGTLRDGDELDLVEEVVGEMKRRDERDPERGECWCECHAFEKDAWLMTLPEYRKEQGYVSGKRYDLMVEQMTHPCMVERMRE